MNGWGDPMNLAGATKGKVDVTALADGRISVAAVGKLDRGAFARYKDTCKGLGCKFDGDLKTWICPQPLVQSVVRQLQAAGLDVRVDGAIYKLAADQEAERERQASIADAHLVGMEMLYKERDLGLYPFQRRGATWMASRDRALLGDDMGVGKTITALTSIPYQAPAGVLVVCIASVKYTWLEEIATWRPDLRATVCKGLDSFRWPEAGEVVILNYELLPLLKGERRTKKGGAAKKKGKRIGTTLAEPWDAAPANLVLIADEAHALKNPKSKRTKRWQGLKSAVLKAGGRVWLLTGTPMKNGSPLDIWNVLRAANLEIDAFGSWQGFREAFDAQDVYFGRVRQIEFGTPGPEVPRMLERVMLRRRRIDVAPELPTKRYRKVTVPEIDDDTISLCDEAMRILNECGIELTIATRQADLSEDSRAFKALAAARSALAAAKIPAMIAEVDRYEAAGEPLVVFCSHRAAIEVLGKREGWAMIVGGVTPQERAAIASDFRAGKYRGIAATIGAGGTGLTFSGGEAQAAHMLMVSRSFSDAENKQAEDRLVRIGNERDSVLVTDLVADHELDRRLYELLLKKQKMAEATLPVTK